MSMSLWPNLRGSEFFLESNVNTIHANRDDNIPQVRVIGVEILIIIC